MEARQAPPPGAPAGAPAGGPPAPPGSFADNIGPWLVGALVEALFTGLAMNECLRFLSRARSETITHNLLVFALLLVALFQFAGLFGVLWHYLIDGRDKPLGVVLIPIAWAQDIVTLMPTLAAFFCQAFLSRRAYVLWKRNYFILGVTGFLTFATLAVGLAWSIWLGISFTLPPGSVNPNSTMSIALSTAPQWMQAGTDIVLCILIGSKLHSTKTNFNKATDAILNRLVAVTITSGLLTSTIALIAAILTQIEKPKGQQLFLTFALQVTPGYCMVVAFSLNSREGLRDKATRSGVSGSSSERSRNTSQPRTTHLSVLSSGPMSPKRAVANGINVTMDTFSLDETGQGYMPGTPTSEKLMRSPYPYGHHPGSGYGTPRSPSFRPRTGDRDPIEDWEQEKHGGMAM